MCQIKFNVVKFVNIFLKRRGIIFVNERKEALSQIELKIFNEIVSSSNCYSTYSAIEKLQFVENAFNNVNSYYSNVLFGLDPRNTKFGFMIGRRAAATAFNGNRAIGFNLGCALGYDDPMEIYKIMFHEFKHIWHNNASLYKNEIALPRIFNARKYPQKPIVKVIDKLMQPARGFATLLTKPFRVIGEASLYRGKSNAYTISMHEASPNEIDADFSAFRNISTILKKGLIKSDKPEDVQKLIDKNRKDFRSNMLNHAAAIGNCLTFGKLFVNPIDREAKKKGTVAVKQPENGLYFLSTNQASKVILANPEAFTDKESIRNSRNLFKSYIKQHGSERHRLSNFFGTFSPHNFRRYAKEIEFARYDRRGRLIDEEEIYAIESLQLNQDDLNTTSTSPLQKTDDRPHSTSTLDKLTKQDAIKLSQPLETQEDKNQILKASVPEKFFQDEYSPLGTFAKSTEDVELQQDIKILFSNYSVGGKVDTQKEDAREEQVDVLCEKPFVELGVENISSFKDLKISSVDSQHTQVLQSIKNGEDVMHNPHPMDDFTPEQ